MVDDRERRLRLLRGSRPDREAETDGRDERGVERDGRDERQAEPGREAAGRDERAAERETGAEAGTAGAARDRAAADRLQRDTLDDLQRRDTRDRIDVGTGPDAERAGERTARNLAAADDLRGRAADDRSIGRIERDQAYDFREHAAAERDDDPALASADIGRADYLDSDADRRKRTAIADEAAADSLAADTEEAPPPTPQRTAGLDENDPISPGARHAAHPPTSTPVARQGGRRTGSPARVRNERGD